MDIACPLPIAYSLGARSWCVYQEWEFQSSTWLDVTSNRNILTLSECSLFLSFSILSLPPFLKTSLSWRHVMDVDNVAIQCFTLQFLRYLNFELITTILYLFPFHMANKGLLFTFIHAL